MEVQESQRVDQDKAEQTAECPPVGEAEQPADTTSRLDSRWLWLWVLLGCLFLYLPWLGTSGLWDPWETHYAEVAREMVESGNWLEPTWEVSPAMSRENKHFFSKPALTLWLMAIGMQLFGVHDDQGGIKKGVEWIIRLPFALLAALGVLAVFFLARHFFGPRVGLLSAMILATCPLYFFLARQAMTDIPLVSLVTMGIALLVLGGFDQTPRPKLLYAGYALLGLSVLAKGLIGFFLPGLVFLLFFLFSGDWSRLGRMRVFSGGLVSLCVAAPWFVYISLISWLDRLLDDEKKTFFERFFLHDHLLRLASGVHGDRGTFAYFIKQLGLGSHPHFPVMVWGTFRSAIRLDRNAITTGQDRVELFMVLWAVSSFALFSLTITKFHHYALPCLPALSILAGLQLDRLKRQNIPKAHPLIILIVVLFVVMISRDIGLMPDNLINLFVYKYTRPFPKEQAFVGQIGFALIFGVMSLGLCIAYLAGKRFFQKSALWFLTLGSILAAMWGGWYFFNAMGPHWSQRHLFETYYALRSQDDPIGAYLMNWRGETFYSRNTVSQLKNSSKLKSWIAKNRDKRMFLIVEEHRLDKLKKKLPHDLRSSLRVLDQSCNKFRLVSVQKSNALIDDSSAGKNTQGDRP